MKIENDNNYQCKVPVELKLSKKPDLSNKFEKDSNQHIIFLKNVRLSFAHLNNPNKDKDGVVAPGTSCDILIPLIPENEKVITNFKKIVDIVAAAKGSSFDKLKGKQARAKIIPLGTPRVDSDGDIKMVDGEPLVAFNSGHLVISTYNSLKSKTKNPVAYFDTKGKKHVPQLNPDWTEGDQEHFLTVTDPVTGKTMQEMCCNGNRVGIKVAITVTEDTRNGNKPKVYYKVIGVQWIADDEQFGSSDDSDDDFGPQDAPTGNLESDDDFNTDVPSESADPFADLDV